MAQGVHKITEQFEQELSRYTGAPYCVCVDNCSNALFLALYYELHVVKDYAFEFSKQGHKPRIIIPRHTYPSVACEIMHAGGKVEFIDNSKFGFPDHFVKGAYFLRNTIVMDSALHFTHDMYVPSTHMCLSFTGPYKHLKLGKGGAILTDDEQAYKWFKKARFSGRAECSYHEDNFDDCPVIGWNFYMLPEIAARGLQMITQFYNQDGTPRHNEDLCLPYPDLSKFKLWQ
jgi:dTDP-4-amino-4,6-dideoxygalactose transaminase